MEQIKTTVEKVVNTLDLKPKLRFKDTCVICKSVIEYEYSHYLGQYAGEYSTICSFICYNKYKDIQDKKYYDSEIIEVPLKFRDLNYDKKIVDENYGFNLFISGESGIGKTTLAASIIKQVIRNRMKIKWISYPAFIMELQNMFRNDKESPFDTADNIANFNGILVIDDLGSEKMTDWVRQITYFIINEREQRELPIIITSNFSLEEIAQQIDIRISSRIAGMCKAIKLSGKDKRLNNQDKNWKKGEVKRRGPYERIL